MIWTQVLMIYWLLRLIGMRSRLIVLIISLCTLIPLQGGVSIAMALRGLWGDPCITTLQLLVLALIGTLPLSLRGDWRLPALIAAISVLLYASALGPWDLDLYRLGYQPTALLMASGAIVLLLWWRGQSLWLWLLTIDLLAWYGGWLESTNFWDYLLDPLLMLVMVILALRNKHKTEVKC
jgi:hypothetical protein